MSDDTAPANETEQAPEGVQMCTWKDFSKIQIKVAEVLACEPHPNADKLLKLQIKVGDKTRQICAGIKAYYEPDALVGRRIVVVDNLEPRKLRGEVSEGMLLAAREDSSDRLSLITTDIADFASGSGVS